MRRNAWRQLVGKYWLIGLQTPETTNVYRVEYTDSSGKRSSQNPDNASECTARIAEIEQISAAELDPASAAEYDAAASINQRGCTSRLSSNEQVTCRPYAN